jgi:hypothetical protein
MATRLVAAVTRTSTDMVAKAIAHRRCTLMDRAEVIRPLIVRSRRA